MTAMSSHGNGSRYESPFDPARLYVSRTFGPQDLLVQFQSLLELTKGVVGHDHATQHIIHAESGCC